MELRPRSTRSKNKLKDIKSTVCSKTSFIKKDVHDEKQDDPGEIILINESDYLVEKVNVVKKSENSHENNANSKNTENSTVHQSVSNCKKIQIQNNFVKKNIENHVHTQTVHEEKKLFQCKICKKLFSNEIDLTWHNEKAHESRMYSKCGSCNINFATVLQVLKHIEKKHFGQPKLECDVCNAVFYQELDYNEHASDHTRNFNKIECETKEKERNYKNDVKSIGNKKSHKCDVCNKIFSEKNNLTLHMEKAHIEGKRYSKCGQCHCDFNSVLEILKHMEKEHFGQNKFECDVCNVMYYKKVDLKEHTSTNHITSAHELLEHQTPEAMDSRVNEELDLTEKLFSCKLCSGTFRYGSHLRKHQGIHSEEKLFQESRMLKSKQRIHTNINPKNCTMPKLREKLDLNEKLFSCQLCSGTFRYGSHLRKHQGVHKNISKNPTLKLHKCKYCQDTFYSLEEHKSHEIQKHKEKLLEISVYKSRKEIPLCEINLAKRRKPVSDVRTPESKDQTPENYVDNKAIPQILDNLSMNNDGGDNKCPYCKSKFSQKHNLKRHIKQKHERNIKTTKEQIGDENSDDKDEIPNNENQTPVCDNQTPANDLKNSNNTSDDQKLEKNHEKTNDKNLKVTQTSEVMASEISHDKIEKNSKVATMKEAFLQTISSSPSKGMI